MKNGILNSKLWISYLIHSLIPILPLILKILIDGNPDAGTLAISATMYIIGAGVSSEKFLFFVLSLFVSALTITMYAIAELTAMGNVQKAATLFFISIFCWIVIVFTMVISFVENYKFYVIECRPLEVKFAKNLIDLTSN